jgi:hypothetical protein
LEYGRWIAIAIAVLRLAIQAVSTVPDFFAMQPPLRCRIVHIYRQLALLRRIAPQKRSMAAAYSYVPDQFQVVYLNTGQGGYAV